MKVHDFTQIYISSWVASTLFTGWW